MNTTFEQDLYPSDDKNCFLTFMTPHLGAPVLARHGGRARLMVFVHGGAGDFIRTWTSADGRTYWPDLVHNDKTRFGFMDVAAFDYTSKLYNTAPGAKEVAHDLRDLLKDAKASSYDDIVIVAHSLGGVVTRQLLVDLMKDKDPLLGNIRLVMSMAGAYGGSALPALLYLTGSQNDQFKDVGTKSSFLKKLNREWNTRQQKFNPEQRQRPFVWSARAKSDTVVTRESAELYCDIRLRTQVRAGSTTGVNTNTLPEHERDDDAQDPNVLFPHTVIENNPGIDKLRDHSAIVKPDGVGHSSHLLLHQAFQLALGKA